MNIVITAALLLALTAQPVVALDRETRIKAGIAILAATGVGLLIAAVSTSRRAIRLVPTEGTGDVLVGRFSKRGFANGGEITLSRGDEQFRGRWARVNASLHPSTMIIATQRGPITALGLTDAGPPTGVAILDGPAGTRLLCAWTGSLSSGAVTCADTSGLRYVGLW